LLLTSIHQEQDDVIFGTGEITQNKEYSRLMDFEFKFRVKRNENGPETDEVVRRVSLR
jgi:hypothetical protein